MEKLIPLMILCADAAKDLKKKEIFPALTIAGTAAGLAVQIFYYGSAWALAAFSMMPGLLFLALSVLSRGQTGAGDALVFFMTGAWLGADVWRVFLLSLFGSAVFAGILWMIKRKNAEFPLVPFILAAFAADVLMTKFAG